MRKRTRDEFPKMKDRAAGRRIRNERRAVRPTLNAIPALIRAVGAAFEWFAAQVSKVMRAAEQFVDTIRHALAVHVHRPFPDGGRWVLRAIEAGPTS